MRPAAAPALRRRNGPWPDILLPSQCRRCLTLSSTCHELPLANTRARQGWLIAILASDTPSAGNPSMAHNEGAPALPSLRPINRRSQVIGHTIASKSATYKLGHRGQYAGEGATWLVVPSSCFSASACSGGRARTRPTSAAMHPHHRQPISTHVQL